MATLRRRRSLRLAGAVHHNVEQTVLDKYPGLFTYDEIHSLENFRGIPEFQPG
ncbi:MAG: hypothetical protein R2774_13220 [Saprospiraceae bacterium]